MLWRQHVAHELHRSLEGDATYLTSSTDDNLPRPLAADSEEGTRSRHLRKLSELRQLRQSNCAPVTSNCNQGFLKNGSLGFCELTMSELCLCLIGIFIYVFALHWLY